MIDQRVFDKMAVPVPEHLLPQFEKSKEKFLHNIDTFYYSVFLEEDLSSTSDDDVDILNFRQYFADRLLNISSDGLPVDILGQSFVLRRSAFQQHYKCCLSIPEKLDIFVSPKLPALKDAESENLLPVFIVQIRSAALWLDGIREIVKYSLELINLLTQFFRFHVKEIQENRIDFCWHTNFFHNPEKYLNPERFAKMCVSRLKVAPYKNIGHFVGAGEVSTSYLALGTRGGHVYFRIYDKVREVLEMHYKPWFFPIWRQEGLISEYDLFCFTYAYETPAKWSRVYGLNLARLVWARDNMPLSDFDRSRCQTLLDNAAQYKADHVLIQEFADQISPQLSKVYNIEYEVKRGMTRNIEYPFPAAAQMPRLAFIITMLPDLSEYITRSTLRLVAPQEGVRLSKCPDSYFWQRLRAAKLRGLGLERSGRQLARNYVKKLDIDIIKKRVINGAITYGLYDDPDSSSDLREDILHFMTSLNDNDMISAFEKKEFKRKILFGNRARDDVFDDSFTENFDSEV